MISKLKDNLDIGELVVLRKGGGLIVAGKIASLGGGFSPNTIFYNVQVGMLLLQEDFHRV